MLFVRIVASGASMPIAAAELEAEEDSFIFRVAVDMVPIFCDELGIRRRRTPAYLTALVRHRLDLH
jgi:hypothetical protein